jgi:ring-1,2-phenylacetyl-CoA epoxidase subunit PaaD
MLDVCGSEADLWDALAVVPDPEIPVISIVDLGLVRGLHLSQDGVCTVTLTPTYSGCPATEVIAADVRQALQNKGLRRIDINTQLSPAWTSDWLSEAAKVKLRAYGIAPPSGLALHEQRIGLSAIGGLSRHALSKSSTAIACPRCSALHTEVLSQHGSTPCKAQYRCVACREPFDYFKPH